jgi:hypothetical protein
VKTKTLLGLVVLVLGLAAWRLLHSDRSPPAAPPPVATRPPTAPPRPARPAPRPAIQIDDADVIDGRVLDAATRDGVPDAKLVFRGPGGDATFTTSSDGTFELTPRATGELVLATIRAPGYAPYSPALAGVHLTLARGRGIHGVALVVERVTRAPSRAAPFDATLTGHVRDPAGAPIAGAVVRAAPSIRAPVAVVVATTGADGAFALAGVDRGAYDLSAEADDHVRVTRDNVLGGSRDIELVLDAGLMIAGRVVDRDGNPVPEFTLIVQRPAGLVRPVVATRSQIDPAGRFALRVAPGDYELIASAHGLARNAPLAVAAGASDAVLVLGAGAVLRGQVIASDDQTPIGRATVVLFAPSPGSDVDQPRAVTRADGSFELAGIPGGRVVVRVHAEGFRARLEDGMFARDGGALGPLTLALTRLGPDVPRGTDQVGIGVGLMADRDALQVVRVMPGSGAFDAGVQIGDDLVAIDGVAVTQLGLDAAFASLLGLPGTPVTVTLRRGDQIVQLTLERRLLRS